MLEVASRITSTVLVAVCAALLLGSEIVRCRVQEDLSGNPDPSTEPLSD